MKFAFEITGALLLVSLIYAVLDASAFQKNAAGDLSAASRWLLAPYLLGAWLNSRWWTRHTGAYSAITPGVWMGRLPRNAAELPRGVGHIIDLCAELPCRAPAPGYAAAPALDLVTIGARQLKAVAAQIAEALLKGPVYVCCALGYSRSAAAVAQGAPVRAKGSRCSATSAP